MNGKIFDLIIIGAGPAGLSVAIEAQKKNLNYLVIEKGGIANSIQYFPTGMTFFSTPELLEIGEIPFTSSAMRPTRVEGLEYYTRVAEFYKLKLHLFEQVDFIQKKSQKIILTTNKDIYHTHNIVIATGYYDNPNHLNIVGEELGKVFHYYSEPFLFYKQNVAVIGGKNSAAIAALELYRHGANVTLIHRGEALSDKIKYWIKPDIENRIKEKNITAYFNTTVKQIFPDSLLLETLRGEEKISNDFVFSLIGYHPDYDFLKNCGIELDEETFTPQHNPETYQTNVKNIYIAGSIVAAKNNNKIFIENGRLHGKKIVEDIIEKNNAIH